MSVYYGNNPYSRPKKVDYGWIGQAFNYFQQSVGIWIVGVILYYIASFAVNTAVRLIFMPAASQANGAFDPNQPYFSMFRVLSASGFWVQYPIDLLITSFQLSSFYGMALKQIRGEGLDFGDLFCGGRYFLNMLLASFILSIMSSIGALVFCVGALVVMGLMMPMYAMVADGEPVLSAISKSIDSMKNDWLNAAGFMFVWGLIMMVSALPCLLGLLVTWPMYFLIGAIAYREMVGLPNLSGNIGYGQPQSGAWPPPPGSTPYNQQQPFGQQYPPQQQSPYGQSQQPAQPQPPFGQQYPPQQQSPYQHPKQPATPQPSYGQPPVPPQPPYGQPPSVQPQPPYGQQEPMQPQPPATPPPQPQQAVNPPDPFGQEANPYGQPASEDNKRNEGADGGNPSA